MTDIVERLKYDAPSEGLQQDALSEIESLRQRVKELEELQKTYNDYYRRQHHPRCDLLEAAGTDSLGNQCTCQQCIEEDVLAAERAISDKLEKVLREGSRALDEALLSAGGMQAGGNAGK